jgi:hypothetical protein
VVLRVESANGWWSGSRNERTGFTSKSGGSPKALTDLVRTRSGSPRGLAAVWKVWNFAYVCASLPLLNR